MMASNDTFERSVLKVRLGNLQPDESVKIDFDMIGRLTCETPNSWTLRIPSHIGPRYETQVDQISKLFKKLLNSKPDEFTSHTLANT